MISDKPQYCDYLKKITYCDNKRFLFKTNGNDK